MKFPLINSILSWFSSKAEPSEELILEEADGQHSSRRQPFCCHGGGHAQYEQIVTCRYPLITNKEERKALELLKKENPVPCGASWHTGCVTKYVMASMPSELTLMDNNGNVNREVLPDRFACCKVWVGDKATVRA